MEISGGLDLSPPRPGPAQCIATTSKDLGIDDRPSQGPVGARVTLQHSPISPSVGGIPVLAQLVTPAPDDATTIVLATCGIAGSREIHSREIYL